jgi:hypothetical protein
MTAGHTRWIGVWQGQLDGQPGVILTLADDGGELAGTIVLNGVSREGGSPHVVVSEPHVLVHPHLDADTFSFQLIRTRDSRELHMTVTLASDEKALLHCADCGPDIPVIELVKAEPTSGSPVSR